MTGTTIAHYKILEKLGEGGMGEVYKAEDTRLDRVIALKFLSSNIAAVEEYRKRFEQEARAAAALNHPNICTIYSVEKHEDRQFISMEYVEGTTLREKIQSGSLETDEVIDYGIQIASALSAAHTKEVIHRDLKPENIMVDGRGQIKVMDFGLARIKGAQNITQKNECIGTAAYMSPEQLRGEKIDLQSDLFSFGIILYEMLTGQNPFRGEYEQATSYRLLNEDPPQELFHKDHPTGLKNLVMQCLQKNPDDRYSSAKEIKNDLENYKKQTFPPALAHGRNLFPSFIRHTDRKFRLMAGVLVLLALLAGTQLYNFGWINGTDWEEIPDEKHLVVLPFNNLSEDAIPASFNDGIMEILTSKITQMGTNKGSLWVVPNSEVRSEQVSSVTEASKLFGTNLAVTGSMHRNDDRFRLTINLVDASSLRQLRSSVLELKWTDFAYLQDEVVRTLANMLEVELAPEAETNLKAGNSQDPQAYQLFIEGRGFLSRFENPEAIEMAIDKFEKALEIDPEYARAWAGLGEAYWRKFNMTNDVQWTKPALKHARKALELNDQLSEVYVTLAMIYNGMGRHEDALDMLDKLMQREEPGYEAQIELANAYSGMGKNDRAEKEYLKAIEHKETYWDGYNQLGVFYYINGRYKEAAEMFKEVTKWTPDNYSAYYRLGATHFAMEQNKKAKEALKKSLELRPNRRAFSNLGTLYFHEGKYQEAIRMFEQSIELTNVDYHIWGNLGISYYWTGKNKEKVRSTLNKAIELAEKMREVMPGDNLLLADLANYYAVIGNRKQVDYLLGQLISNKIQDPGIMVMIAEAYEMIGERSAAISWLEKALEQGYAWKNIKKKPVFTKEKPGFNNQKPGWRILLEDPQMQNLREKYE